MTVSTRERANYSTIFVLVNSSGDPVGVTHRYSVADQWTDVDLGGSFYSVPMVTSEEGLLNLPIGEDRGELR